ncbi:thiamine-phosphate kinase [Acinetobacter sp. MD2(2019)]|uniref:thiamine-phosphate kinase n=1 Tax=Acinetobacter sp. MD2(2019) TaxID=2605273 RepID=UPI002D1F524C|nr:thiamine-phosphate kinase [Acinetobacter sp. MD2(2019)]MEB3754903.1 thiamine-phosphate kinase [Acinetobacter sp. MD2(2019)]
MAEFSIIDRYFKTQQLNLSETELGIGDDSAVLSPPVGQQLVICTDTLIAGRHFPLSTSAHAIGWKSVAVNLSDLAAMGSTPHSILLAISLPSADEAWLHDFAQGLFDCCAPYNVQLIGGDTTQSPHLTITVTALGWVPHGHAIGRHDAKVGDYIVVSGQLGDAAYALKHLGHPLQHRLDYPTPRCALGQSLISFASSMIDVSDGLVQDLGHILNASKVGACIHLEQLPIDAALSNLALAEQWQYALAGGDDYELCFTISPQKYTEFLLQNPTTSLSIIGEIQASQGLEFCYQGQQQDLALQGYQHFA